MGTNADKASQETSKLQKSSKTTKFSKKSLANSSENAFLQPVPFKTSEKKSSHEKIEEGNRSVEEPTQLEINWDYIEREAFLLLEEGVVDVTEMNQLIQEFSRQVQEGKSLLQYAMKMRLISPEKFVKLHKIAMDMSHLVTKSAQWNCTRQQNKIPVFKSSIEIFGHYQIHSILGRGGMGIVYKAMDTRLNRVVALKMLRDEDNSNQKRIRRFLQEGKSAAKLSHRGIVPIYELGEIDDTYFMAMKYIEGETLDHYLKKQHLSTRNKVQLVLEIAEALFYAHQNQIIHRDLKPSNIIIDREGHINIMDFGLAKDLTSDTKLTQTNEFMGSPRYMSPEHIQYRKQITPHMDQFSLGILFYEMLSGRLPFNGTTQIQIFHQILHFRPAAPSSYGKTSAKELDWVCKKMLEKIPEDRYRSLEEVITDLRDFLEGKALKVSRMDYFSSQFRRIRRNGWKWSIGGVAFVLLSVLVWTWFERQNLLQETLKKQKEQEEELRKKERWLQEQKQQETVVALQKFHKLQELFLKDQGLVRLESKALFENATSEQKSLFLELLQKDQKFLKQGMLRLLAQYAYPEAIAPLKELLVNSSEEEEQILILQALRYSQASFSLTELKPYLQSQSSRLQWYALQNVERLSLNEETLSFLIPFFQNALEKEPRFCLLLAPFFAQFALSSVLEPLKQGANATHGLVREICLKILVEFHFPEVLALFKPEEELSAIRLLFIRALTEKKTEETYSLLWKYLKEKHLITALAALEALESFPGRFFTKDQERLKDQKNQILRKNRNTSILRSQARQQFDLGNYAKALPKLNEILESIEDEETSKMRGKCYQELKDPEQAVKDYLEVLKRSISVENYVLLAESLRTLGMDDYALEFLDKALRLDPENVSALQEKGTVLIFKKAFEEAIEVFTQALKVEANATAYQMLGQAYFYKEWYDLAIETYQKAIALDPNNGALYLTQGMTYLNIEKLDLARHCFQKALELDPKKVSPYYFMGESYFRELRFDTALEYFTKALEIDGTDRNALARIAHIEYERKNFTEAHHYIEEALKLSNSAYMFLLQAKIFKKENKIDQALESLAQVKEDQAVAPEHYIESLYVLAHCQFAKGRFKEAFSALQEAKNRGYPITLEEWKRFKDSSE
jgi:tetratricopeptide (TPR) repeat protein/tRNA A-37 threonylcarbamoyl transferase component Bud32